MSFPSPNLDDRTAQGLIDEAKRLIPKYCPEWTNHNVSDPGVALIELFAWMTDMIIYRMNQVPDRFYTHFLDLVGIEPYPAAAARTELTFWLSSEDLDPVTIPTGTQASTATIEGAEPVVFMTEETLVVRRPELTTCVTGTAGSDAYPSRWSDLTSPNTRVTCFGSQPARAGDAVYFGFAAPLTGNVIRVDVTGPTKGLGIDPDDPPLRWEVWAGEEEWIPARVHRDTTGGLNQSGSVTLLIPLAHEVLTLGLERAFWLRARFATPEEGQAAYRNSPEIGTVRVVALGGTVPARHGQPAPPESLGRSTGEPGQKFTVAHTPVINRHAGETVRVITEEGATDWEERGDFGDSQPDERHFTWDSRTGEIAFGPLIRYANPKKPSRQYGAVPPSGAEITVTGYRYGGGVVGNVGRGTITTLLRTIPYVDRVENLIPAKEGVDTETIANAKMRAPMQLRTGERAVTARDFQHLALEAAPAVARAQALPPETPGGPVRLLVVPRVGIPAEDLRLDDFAISEDLVTQIATHLDERRTLGTTVEIGAPFYQGVSVVCRVRAKTGREPGLVRQRCVARLFDFINPTIGGADGSGWPFARDLNAGAVFQRLASVEGVDRVEEVLLFEADARTEKRYGRGKERIELSPNSLFLSMRHKVLVE